MTNKNCHMKMKKRKYLTYAIKIVHVKNILIYKLKKCF